MNKIFYSILVFALLTGITLGDTIKIPVISSYSGKLTSYGNQAKNGALLKEEEVNASGGINGKKLKILFEDDLCEPTKAASIAQKLAENSQISIIIGHTCSSATLAALPIYREAHLPAITPASTNVNIGKMSSYYFRNVYRDDFQGLFLAKYIHEIKKYQKVAIFYEVNDYSMELMFTFMKEAMDRGIRILGTEAYTEDTADFIPQLAKFKKIKPDAIFIPGYPPQASLIISQAVRMGLKTSFFGGDGLDGPTMLENPDAERLFIAIPFLADQASASAQNFISDYKKKYDILPEWSVGTTYDAVGLAVAAIKAVGEDRIKITKWLAAIDSEEKGYEGVTGKIWFDKNGDRCVNHLFIKEIRKGKWVSAERQLQ